MKPFLGLGTETPPDERLSTELETSESALRVALHRLRKRYGELVHLCVLDLVADPSNVDAEITDLLNVLAN